MQLKHLAFIFFSLLLRYLQQSFFLTSNERKKKSPYSFSKKFLEKQSIFFFCISVHSVVSFINTVQLTSGVF